MFNNTINSIFARKTQPSGNKLEITPDEFKVKLARDRGVIIDVRTRREYEEGHLKNAVQYSLMNGEFHQKLESLDKNKTYYLYCRSGNRSGQAARIMKQHGFENVYNIGGFGQLAYAGLEIER